LQFPLFGDLQRTRLIKHETWQAQAKRRQKALSLKRIFKALGSLGLSQAESKVYVYLAKIGPSKARDLSRGLGMTKQQLYPALSSLKKKGIVTSRPERATVFAAIAFEELLNFFLKVGVEQQKTIEKTKKELANSWFKIAKQDKD
jgi:sugar-specific transcriptional regulator TrmB